MTFPSNEHTGLIAWQITLELNRRRGSGVKLSERAERVLLFFYERHSLAHSPIARVAKP